MKVNLVSYSRVPDDSELPDDMLQLVAYCARVSNPSNQNNTETSEKLVKYLIKHKHWSPLEMVNVCLEIDTTRDIARQLLRHRSFTFQEFSQRYANPDEGFDNMFEKREARLQDEKNRQNSVVTDDEAIAHFSAYAGNGMNMGIETSTQACTLIHKAKCQPIFSQPISRRKYIPVIGFVFFHLTHFAKPNSVGKGPKGAPFLLLQ